MILAGGFGTRLTEYTDIIPKPMVPIGAKPILWHIMERYASFGHLDFFLALGYKAELIKQYFLNFHSTNSDFSLNLTTGQMNTINSSGFDWNVTLVDTGLNSMTGGRVKRLQNLIGNEPFLLTYGDGLADIDINALIKFHKNHGKMVTVTAVRPVARFGEIEIANDNSVKTFKEKPHVTRGWINGGFFVIQPEFFELIDDDSTILERKPLELAASMGELQAYRHEGFWQCMDTKRDKDYLEELWQKEKAPWTN